MKLVPLLILLLSTATRISGEDTGFVEDTFLPCPGTVEKKVNNIFSTVTSKLNDGWKAFAQTYDPIDLDVSMGSIPFPGSGMLSPICLGEGSVSAAKADVALYLPEINGISNLNFKELKVTNHNAGEGKSCNSDPEAGPFRCVLEGEFAADAGVDEGIKAELKAEVTIDCKKGKKFGWTIGKDKTVVKTYKGLCTIAEDVLDLAGTYCAGQCNNMIPIVNSMKVNEAAFKLGDITCDFGDDLVSSMLEMVVNNSIDTLVGDKLSVNIAGPINSFLGSTFPFPTTCAAEKKMLRST